MLPAAAWLASATSLLYFFAPRVPLYRVTSLRIESFQISSILSLEFSAKITAGVMIDNNANFVGAHVHSAYVDVFYAEGLRLVHLGEVRDSNGTHMMLADERDDDNDRNNDDEGECRIYEETRFLDQSLPDRCRDPTQKVPGRRLKRRSVDPFFTVHPRQTTHSVDDAVSIFLRNVRPGTYLRIVRDAVKSGGSFEIATAGIAHLSSSSVPLTVGVICDNVVSLEIRYPIHIIGRECVVEKLATGWADIATSTTKLREEAMRRFEATGSVLTRVKSGTAQNVGDEVQGTSKVNDESFEPLVEWHTF